jgi:hypothetical protein
MEPEGSLPHSKLPVWTFRNFIRFYGEELLAPRPTPKLEDHPASAVRDCLFNISADTFQIRGRSSIRTLGTRHAVVTGTHLTWQGMLLPFIYRYWRLQTSVVRSWRTYTELLPTLWREFMPRFEFTIYRWTSVLIGQDICYLVTKAVHQIEIFSFLSIVPFRDKVCQERHFRKSYSYINFNVNFFFFEAMLIISTYYSVL